MFDIFMSFQLNIQQFKCFARFGLMHIVATNICVWIRTVFKVDFEKSMKAKSRTDIFQEGIKDIAAYRVARGEGVSEDFMIKGHFNFRFFSLAIFVSFCTRKSFWQTLSPYFVCMFVHLQRTAKQDQRLFLSVIKEATFIFCASHQGFFFAL